MIRTHHKTSKINIYDRKKLKKCSDLRVKVLPTGSWVKPQERNISLSLRVTNCSSPRE